MRMIRNNSESDSKAIIIGKNTIRNRSNVIVVDLRFNSQTEKSRSEFLLIIPKSYFEKFRLLVL